MLSTQQQLRWATVPEQSGPKSGGCCAPFSEGSWDGAPKFSAHIYCFLPSCRTRVKRIMSASRFTSCVLVIIEFDL